MYHTALIVGPAVGGVIVGSAGLELGLRDRRRELRRHDHRGLDDAAAPAAARRRRRTRPSSSGWQRLADGFRFLRGRRVLQSTFIVDLIAMIFGMPRALFPILAVVQFHGGAEEVGRAVLGRVARRARGALTTGWVHRVRRQGLAIIVVGRRCGAARLPRSVSPATCIAAWPFCVSLWRAGLMSCRRCSVRRSCRTRCPTTCAVDCRASTSRSSRVVRGSATSKPASSPRCSARRSRWSPAGCCAWSGSGCSRSSSPSSRGIGAATRRRRATS